MSRRGVTAVGMAVGGLLLGGCSPAELPLAAVSLGEDGEPVAIVRPCGDDRIGPLHLFSGAGEAGADPGTSWSQTTDARVGRTSFPLFSPPGSLGVSTYGPQRLSTGARYYLDISGGRGWDAYNVSLTFTSEDLAGLQPGQVWADGRAMSRDGFDDLVSDKC
ncbi:hypothetical protein [Streptomyces cylindrosporus]|uniref:Lipoprotein n=1 Tax=Streptomyces cylindrosporus TaxID=2927583 RepID=A0ABS9Y7W8_9ACTN|nr:hypothetical protein [Streptomyces cylindrosporus]MCI3273324.1 hypothetical protein [Streptomyces cylindrosporus]